MYVRGGVMAPNGEAWPGGLHDVFQRGGGPALGHAVGAAGGVVRAARRVGHLGGPGHPGGRRGGVAVPGQAHGMRMGDQVTCDGCEHHGPASLDECNTEIRTKFA